MLKKVGDKSLYISQINVNVSFTAFMTAVVVFFIGVLLSRFETFNILIKVPISFLIISFFGFLYSTLIFANAMGEVFKSKLKMSAEHEHIGNVISEYLGVYLLVLALPLVINVITTDWYLRSVTLIATLAGLIVYQSSHFSLVARHFGKKHAPLSMFIFLFAVVLFISQIYEIRFIEISTAFLIVMALITYWASRRHA